MIRLLQLLARPLVAIALAATASHSRQPQSGSTPQPSNVASAPSQLPCGDLVTRYAGGAPDAGPKRSPLGLAADGVDGHLLHLQAAGLQLLQQRRRHVGQRALAADGTGA